jgi:phosphoribosylformylglycinamidine synthase
MASKGEVGIDIDLCQIPLREPGMEPFEIMVSESQERMLCVVAPERVGAVLDVCEHWEVLATPIGSVTTGDRLRVLKRGAAVADLPVKILVDDCPLYDLEPEPPEQPLYRPPAAVLSGTEPSERVLVTLLGSANIASRQPVFEQYDPVVQSRTVRRPDEADAAVLMLPRGAAIAVSIDGNGRRVACDPRGGAAEAVYECAANLACVGAEPLGLTNCLNFGNPEKPHIMWQFSQTIDGITKACEELEIPITGGNVSFYNETLGEGIYPTPVLGVVGILEDVHKAAKMYFAAPGRTIVLLRAGEAGDITDAEIEFGSSEYAKEILDTVWGYPPELDLEKEADLQKVVIEMVQRGLVDSTHDCADGGLAVALAEKAFPKGVGARVNLASSGLLAEFALFGEDASRIVISCDPEQVARIKEVAGNHRVDAEVIGETIPDRLEISLDGKVVISAAVSELSAAYEGALESALRTDPELVAAD